MTTTQSSENAEQLDRTTEDSVERQQEPRPQVLGSEHPERATVTTTESPTDHDIGASRRKRAKLLNKRTGKRICYGDTISLSEMTQSMHTTNSEEAIGTHQEPHQNEVRGEALATDRHPAQQEGQIVPAGQSGQDDQESSMIETTLQALLGIHATQPEPENVRDSRVLQQDAASHRIRETPWRGAHRPSNHPMSTQCTIRPTDLTVAPPHTMNPTSDSGETNAADRAPTDTLQRMAGDAGSGHAAQFGQSGIHDNANHADYLMVGSDIEAEDAAPKDQGRPRPRTASSSHHPDDDDDQSSSDEERTPPPTRFSSGKELHPSPGILPSLAPLSGSFPCSAWLSQRLIPPNPPYSLFFLFLDRHERCFL